MQDMTVLPSINGNTGRHSQISETDYEIHSKPTTAKTEQKRTSPRLPSFQPDAVVAPKLTHRHKRSYTYAPAASDRESWWRVTIKVHFKLDFEIFLFL
jgi:hypothetical protein